jgi:hypothetical protein
MNTRLFLFLFLTFPIAASAEIQGPVASESRDAATAYILTQNFIIGRTARDCFANLERTDTPKEFVALWQKQNTKYFSAAITYMNRRLTEAESLSGVEARNNVANALNAAINKDGSGAVNSFFKTGEKQEICKRVIGLMEAGVFNIDSRSPMYGELQALVSYVEGR